VQEDNYDVKTMSRLQRSLRKRRSGDDEGRCRGLKMSDLDGAVDENDEEEDEDDEISCGSFPVSEL